MVPKSLSKEFFKNLLKGVEHENDNGVIYVDCFTRLEDVFLMFEKRWVQISGADMVMDISSSQDGSLCIVNFLPSVDNFWVLGNHIYKDYYVTHKPDAGAVGFTPTENQRKAPLYSGARPNRKLQKGYDGWALFGKLLASSAFGVGAWALTEYGFGGESAGFDGSDWIIDFLNAGSNRKQQSKKAIADKIKSMS
jgi:hypothetical protein